MSTFDGVLPARVCRLLSLVIVRGEPGIVIGYRPYYRFPLRLGGEPTLANFLHWHFRIACLRTGDTQWWAQEAFVVVEDQEDVADAIRLIRESEVNPPDHGLVLFNDIGVDCDSDTGERKLWNLQLWPLDGLLPDPRKHALNAWNNGVILDANLPMYYSSKESEVEA